MKDRLKQEVLKDLSDARTFVGQAQNRLGMTRGAAEENNCTELWQELGELFDQIDDIIEEVKDRDVQH